MTQIGESGRGSLARASLPTRKSERCGESRLLPVEVLKLEVVGLGRYGSPRTAGKTYNLPFPRG